MPSYSLSPYAIWFAPRYERGGERRPIGDVDGNGKPLKDAITSVLTDLQGSSLVPDSEDDSRLVRVNRFEDFGNFVFVEFGVARAGLVGKLHRAKKGTVVPIDVDDSNETFLRSVFVFVPATYEAYWLVERAGMASPLSLVETKLVARFKELFPDITHHVDPVAEWGALTAWADKVLVKELRFSAPREGKGTQAIDVNGVNATIEVVVKPKGSLPLSKLLNKEGPRKKAVFGFLSNGIYKRTKGVSAGSVIEQGWAAKVSFTTPSGRQRSFGVSTEDKAPSLVYPIGSDNGASQRTRPTSIQMLKACAEFLADITANLPAGSSIADEVSKSRPAH